MFPTNPMIHFLATQDSRSADWEIIRPWSYTNPYPCVSFLQFGEYSSCSPIHIISILLLCSVLLLVFSYVFSFSLPSPLSHHLFLSPDQSKWICQQPLTAESSQICVDYDRHHRVTEFSHSQEQQSTYPLEQWCHGSGLVLCSNHMCTNTSSSRSPCDPQPTWLPPPSARFA